MPMKLSTRQIKPGIVLLELAGRVSMGDDCTLLDSEVERHIQKNENRVIFDLAGVNHVENDAALSGARHLPYCRRSRRQFCSQAVAAVPAIHPRPPLAQQLDPR
jgi:hypothetical protein